MIELRNRAVCLNDSNLELREVVDSDFESIRDLLNDRETMNFLKFMRKSSDGWTKEQVRERLTERSEKRKRGEGLYFSIFDSSIDDSSGFVGQCSFNAIDRNHHWAEYGIIIRKEYWRRGIGIRSTLLCLEYGFENLGLNRIQMSTFPENYPVVAMLKRLGVDREAVLREAFYDDGRYKDRIIFSILAGDWCGIKEAMRALLKRR